VCGKTATIKSIPIKTATKNTEINKKNIFPFDVLNIVPSTSYLFFILLFFTTTLQKLLAFKSSENCYYLLLFAFRYLTFNNLSIPI